MGNFCINNKNTTEKNITQFTPTIFDIDISNINRQTYTGIYKYCRFSNVYDGDTADIYFFDEFKVVRRPFRFYGYDSAEIKPLKSASNRDEIKIQAHEDLKFLAVLLVNSKCVVKFMDNEKYGRMMGQVWKINDSSIPEHLLMSHPELIEDNNIASIMIKSGHGKPYYGGSKNH
jgi:endonuclease YncB( thermonuclease family)